MRRDQQEELRRLEEALLAAEENPSEEWDIPQELYVDPDYAFYDEDAEEDIPEEDFDDYEEEFPQRRSPVPIIVFLLSIALLLFMILWCLKLLGVIA